MGTVVKQKMSRMGRFMKPRPEWNNRMTASERIKALRDALNKNPTQFSADIGVPRTTLLGWEGGKSVPIETAEKIFQAFPMINLGWLLSGTGEMFTMRPENAGEDRHQIGHEVQFDDGELNSTPENDAIPYSVEGEAVPMPAEAEASGSPTLVNGLRLRGRRAVEMDMDAECGEDVFVEFYSSLTAGAGPGREVDLFEKETPLKIMSKFLAPWRPEQAKALEVRGDSMTKVGLFDRDIVLFVPEEKEGDGIFVISIENRLQVKRLEFDILGKTLRIISENDRYEPRILETQDEIDRVKIAGKVIGWMHRHPY